MTLKPDMRVLRSIFGLSTQNEISSITLPASAFRSKAALLSCRDSILAWIVRERLCNPGSEKSLLRVSIPTLDGSIKLKEVVNSSTSAG